MVKVYETKKKGLGGGSFLRYELDHTGLDLMTLYYLARSEQGVELEAENPERYFLAALKRFEEKAWDKQKSVEYANHLVRRSGEYKGLLNYIEWLEAITGVR